MAAVAAAGNRIMKEQLRSIGFWCAVPFVFPQALYVRSRAPRFDAPASNRKHFFGEGETSGKKFLALGDSIIAGVGAEAIEEALVGQTAFALSQGTRLETHLFGKIGIDSRGIKKQMLPSILEHFDNEQSSVDYILLSTGVNDATSLITRSEFTDNLQHCVETLSERHPSALIALAGIPPLDQFPLLPSPLSDLFGVRSKMLAECAQRIADRFDHIAYLGIEGELSEDDFSADGYHPNPKTYREFGTAIAETLLELEKQYQN